MVKMVKWDHKVSRDCLDRLDPQETRDQLEHLVKTETLELLEIRVLEVMLAKMDQKGQWDPLDPQEHLEREVHQVLVDQGDFKECLELLVKLECLERMEKLDYLVNLE